MSSASRDEPRTYTPHDIADGLAERLGSPGSHPFTRGIRKPSDEVPPVIGQYAGAGSPDRTNAIWRELLDQGADALYLALDLPTQHGFDSDDPRAAGEVGRVGVALDTVADIETALAGLPLASLRSLKTTANAISPLMLAMLIVAIENLGFAPDDCRIGLQNDVLKEYSARGTYIFPPAFGLRCSVDVIEYCARELPTWRPLSVCGSHMRGAGASPIQELAFSLANGYEYIGATIQRGLPVEAVVRDWELQLGTGMEIVLEVARFRAARRLWSSYIMNDLDCASTSAQRLSLRTICSGVTMTAQQPLNNIVRATIEVLAGLLGGSQHLRAYPYDEALGLPTPESQQTALRTQQILMEETDLSSFVDPLGGAYALEAMTDRVEQLVKEELALMREACGDTLSAIESGYVQSRIGESAYRDQLDVERGERTIVGVNKYVNDASTADVPTLKHDRDTERLKIDGLRTYREKRNASEVASALRILRQAAIEERNIIPSAIECARAECTLGEMCSQLREVFGEHTPTDAY